MRIFVINLERRPDRLESIATRLNMLGLEFERVQAFDGMNNSVKHLVSWPKAILFNYLQRPSLGVIGCYQSHRLVFQKIVKDKIPQALVLEDDAELHDWDPEILKVNISDIGLE